MLELLKKSLLDKYEYFIQEIIYLNVDKLEIDIKIRVNTTVYYLMRGMIIPLIIETILNSYPGRSGFLRILLPGAEHLIPLKMENQELSIDDTLNQLKTLEERIRKIS